MTTADRRDGASPARLIRAPRNLAGGLMLIALAAVSAVMTLDLDQGSLRQMGPGMLPFWLALGVGACGVALVAASLMRDGEGFGGAQLRGPLLVVLAILAFAATIRPMHLGAVTTPGFGLIVAGPLAILIGGFATPEARLRELVVLALALTAFCMVLFGDALNLPIPVLPRALADLFPSGWSQKLILRVAAAALAVAAALIYLAGHGRSRRAGTVVSGAHDE